MDIQRARNLTTGRLHTEMDHIYQDIEMLTGEKGIMTHMLPRALDCLLPHLKKHVQDSRFWDDKFDITHVGEIEIPPLNGEDRAAFLATLRQPP